MKRNQDNFSDLQAFKAYLVELHEHEDGNEVHEGGVELEGDVGGTDVIAGAHNPLHEEGQAQGEVEAVLGRHSVALRRDGLILTQESVVLQFLKVDDGHKEQAKHAVAEITENVIEISKKTQRLSA